MGGMALVRQDVEEREYNLCESTYLFFGNFAVPEA